VGIICVILFTKQHQSPPSITNEVSGTSTSGITLMITNGVSQNSTSSATLTLLPQTITTDKLPDTSKQRRYGAFLVKLN
jgi:hypothetical protein